MNEPSFLHKTRIADPATILAVLVSPAETGPDVTPVRLGDITNTKRSLVRLFPDIGWKTVYEDGMFCGRNAELHLQEIAYGLQYIRFASFA